MKVFVYPGAEFHQKAFSTSEDPRYRTIGQNRFIIPSSWDHFDQLLQQVFSEDKLIYLVETLDSSEKAVGHWYRSDEPST